MFQDSFGRGISETQVHAGTSLAYHLQASLQATPRHKVLVLNPEQQYNRCDTLLQELPSLEPLDRNVTNDQRFENLGWEVFEGVPYTAWVHGSSFSTGTFWDEDLFDKEVPHQKDIRRRFHRLGTGLDKEWKTLCLKLNLDVTQLMKSMQEELDIYIARARSNSLVPGENQILSQEPQDLHKPQDAGNLIDSTPAPPSTMNQDSNTMPGPSTNQSATAAMPPATPPAEKKMATVLVPGTPSEAVSPTQAAGEPDDSIQSWTASTAPDPPVDDPISSWESAPQASGVGQEDVSFGTLLGMDVVEQSRGTSESGGSVPVLITQVPTLDPEQLAPAPADDPDDPDKAPTQSTSAAVPAPAPAHKRKRSEGSDTLDGPHKRIQVEEKGQGVGA